MEEAGISDRLHADLTRLLRRSGDSGIAVAVIDIACVQAFGGEQIGVIPADRHRPGTKPTLLVSRTGVPLSIRTTGVIASDHR